MSEQAVATFIELFQQQERRTRTGAKATMLMHELANAVRATGKTGEIIIKIKVSPDKNDELALNWKPTVKASIPEEEAKVAVFYHNPETKTFSKTDPRQLELLAEQESERAEREEALREKGIAQIGRGAEPALATG